MKCRRAKRLLPLATGGDLLPWKTRRLDSHLKKCPGCRRELQAYRAALLEIKSWAQAEPQGDWSETEWRAALELATGQGRGKTRPVAGPFPNRLAWTMGSALVLLLAVGSILIFRNRGTRETRQPPPPYASYKSQEPATSPGSGPASPASPELKAPAVRSQIKPRLPLGAEEMPSGRPAEIQAAKKQDVVNMVFVSPQSGLTIHWVLNSEFEWKEKYK